jgi:hypothetical protein
MKDWKWLTGTTCLWRWEISHTERRGGREGSWWPGEASLCLWTDAWQRCCQAQLHIQGTITLLGPLLSSAKSIKEVKQVNTRAS